LTPDGPLQKHYSGTFVPLLRLDRLFEPKSS